MYSGKLLCSVAAAAIVAATAPAMAQAVLPDVTVEGPIVGITVQTEPLPALLGAGNTVGTIRVMGVDIKVRADASVSTATNTDLGDTDSNPATPSDNAAALARLGTGELPGRPGTQGFIGGTAIVTGDSLGGFIYASSVFSDLFENVVVGEATADANSGTVAVQFMNLIPINDARMPAKSPLSIYGFQINPLSIDKGTLVSAEGYFSKTADGENLYYHTLEADSAALLQVNGKFPSNVSVTRAQCRIRGRNRDELSVRGGVHSTFTTVAIQVPAPVTTANPSGWRTVGNSGRVVADPLTANPQQGEYRFDSSALNLNGACPSQIRALYTVNANSTANTAIFSPDIR